MRKLDGELIAHPVLSERLAIPVRDQTPGGRNTECHGPGIRPGQHRGIIRSFSFGRGGFGALLAQFLPPEETRKHRDQDWKENPAASHGGGPRL